MQNKHSISDLRQMQSLPLNIKLSMTKRRIREWVEYFGEDMVYISFSGGKDSTVLLDIARNMYPNICAVFVDTGLEYPEVRNFVNTFQNVTVIKPKMTFRQVIQKFGYPFISKEVSAKIDYARRYLALLNDSNRDKSKPMKYAHGFADVFGIDRRDDKNNPAWVAIKNGTITDDIIKEYSKRSKYDAMKYAYLMNAPFNIAPDCCRIMKKNPVHKFENETGKKPIMGQMADESILRMQKWLKNGCNGFNMSRQVSNPMFFWTENDVLEYIYSNNLKIAEIYGCVIRDEVMDVDGVRVSYHTTGASRTGCMFCGYGCHLTDDGRFKRMKYTHPKQYNFIMKPVEDGGLGYRKIIDWMNENGGFNISY